MTSRQAAKRPYRMTTRAEAAAATGERIVLAAIRLFGERLFDEVSLADVAAEAGVTVQTVLRRFGSKEDLLASAIRAGTADVERQRGEAPVGDVAGAVKNLVAHYETWGDRSVRFLAQEERVPVMRRVTATGRALHHAWVDRVFAPWLARARGAARARLRARLIAATDVYVWKIMRRDLGLDAQATETSIRELVAALLGSD